MGNYFGCCKATGKTNHTFKLISYGCLESYCKSEYTRQIHLFRIIVAFSLFPPFQMNFMYMYVETYMHMSVSWGV